MVSIQYFPTFAVFFMLAFLAPRLALAEVVILKNNDRLTGEIVEDSEETLTLEHPTLGRIVVPKSDIKPAAVATESDGALDETMSRMGMRADGTHESGRAEEEKEAVADEDAKQALQEEGEEPVVVAEEDVELSPNTGVFGTRILQDWKRTIAVGLKGEDGDSVSRDWNFALNGSYEDETKKWDFQGRYIIETDDRKNSERKGNIRLTRDWYKLDSRWFNYAQLRYDYDRYKYWNHRVVPFAGRGYKLFWDEKLKFSMRGGLGGRRDWGTENDFNPEAEIGLQLDWRSHSLRRFELKSSLYPDLDDTGEYRTVSGVLWAFRFSESSSLSLRLGADHTYDSKINPLDDEERHYDLLYYGALGLDF
ncbi:MAG: DUF481 domain-containing protein [Deltaproteobacteria bacterium]|nr:DUF481 domain-containing protein [Deltaproteobacteria bacterium]